MNFFQALGLVLLVILFRLITKTGLQEYYFTNFGYAIAVLVSLGATIFLSKRIFKKITFFPTKSVTSNVRNLLIGVTAFLFLTSTIVSEFEELITRGSDLYFKDQFTFGLSQQMKQTYLSAILISPILEELFFNGILLQGFLRKYSPKISIILVTMIFMLFHFGRNEADFLITSKISIALSEAFTTWVVLRTSNIRLGIFLHFFWNLSQYLFPFVIGIIGLNSLDSDSLMFFLSTTLLISCIMLVRNVRQLHYSESLCRQPSG